MASVIRKMPKTPLKKEDSHSVLFAYLNRIGFSLEEAKTLAERKPSVTDLNAILRHHILAIPFENLGQHCHPSGGKNFPSRSKQFPSLDIHRTLEKLLTHISSSVNSVSVSAR